VGRSANVVWRAFQFAAGMFKLLLQGPTQSTIKHSWPPLPTSLAGIVGSTTGSNYYVRILSTLNRCAGRCCRCLCCFPCLPLLATACHCLPLLATAALPVVAPAHCHCCAALPVVAPAHCHCRAALPATLPLPLLLPRLAAAAAAGSAAAAALHATFPKPLPTVTPHRHFQRLAACCRLSPPPPPPHTPCPHLYAHTHTRAGSCCGRPPPWPCTATAMRWWTSCRLRPTPPLA